MGVNFTDKVQNNVSLMNVSYYDSKAEYIRLTFLGIETDEEAAEVFDEQMDSGFLQDITCGTYNGATDEFTPWQLSDNNTLDTILNALHDDDFYNFVAMYTDEMADLEQWSKADWIREYTEVYEVFIIGGRVYVNQD